MRKIEFHLTDSVHNAIRKLIEKISALMTDEYLSERAQQGSHAKFEAALSKVPDKEDRL